MGATITCARKVGAILADDGQVYYALFEQTYESNCYPHTPSWECVGFGTGRTVVEQIFRIGSAVCGGMLRGRSRQLTPLGYIGSWMSALKRPYMLKDISIKLRVVDKEFVSYGEISEKCMPPLKDRLRSKGHDLVADYLDTGEYRIDRLSAEADVLALIVNGGMAWRYIGRNDLTEQPASGLGWNPPKTKQAPIYNLPGVYRIDGAENIVVQGADGLLDIGDWQYSLEAGFVSGYGVLESSCPGHWRNAMTDLKKHFEHMPYLPDSAVITIERENVKSGFSHCADELIGYLGSKSGTLDQIPIGERHNLGYVRGGVVIEVPDRPAQCACHGHIQASLI